MILSLAAGEVSEESLARWIRDNWPKRVSVSPIGLMLRYRDA